MEKKTSEQMTDHTGHSKPCGRFHNRSQYEKNLRLNNPAYAKRQSENSLRWAKAHREHLNEYNRKRREREKAWPEGKKRASKIRRTAAYWGVSPADYEAFIGQRQACEICGSTKGRMHVDHNHKTGMVRGVLCHACNYGIGCLKDDPGKLEAAALYLRSREANPPLPAQRPRPRLMRHSEYKQWKTIKAK